VIDLYLGPGVVYRTKGGVQPMKDTYIEEYK